jgi:hypothetical protein
MRVLITAGRDHPDRAMVWSELDRLAAQHGPLTVVHGACHLGGGDLYAQEWCDTNPGRGTAEPHPAADFGPWPKCGPLRNAHMVRLGADVCLGFPTPKSRGTWNCLRAAKRSARVDEVRVVRLPNDPPRRITRSRRTGAELPPSAIYCGRPGPLGNPWHIGQPGVPTAAVAAELHRRWLRGEPGFDRHQRNGHRTFDRDLALALTAGLAGWDLACWCQPGPCHAGELLRLANGGA